MSLAIIAFECGAPALWCIGTECTAVTVHKDTWRKGIWARGYGVKRGGLELRCSPPLALRHFFLLQLLLCAVSTLTHDQGAGGLGWLFWAMGIVKGLPTEPFKQVCYGSPHRGGKGYEHGGYALHKRVRVVYTLWERV